MRVVDTPFSATGLGRLNPVAKLLAATIVMVGLLVTADLVTASVVLGAELISFALARISLLRLVRLSWPLFLGAAGVAAANLVASSASSTTIAAVSLRLIAIGLPGLLVFASTDAVDLADSLVQQARLPYRFAYGSLAAVRLLPLLGEEWQMIGRARRARGLDPGRSPVRRLVAFFSSVYTLLIAAIRKATRLAMAMDSRGFDARGPRTIARRQKIAWRDYVLVVLTLSVVGGANALALVLGTWHPLLS